MLVRRKKLAFVSATPGKTTEINFFLVNNAFMLADLPGFGFAKASREQRAFWEKQRQAYLFKREQVRLICILVDSRHDPNEEELSLIENLELHRRRYLIVLTKGDKITKTHMQERVEQLRELVAQCSYCVDVLPTSSETNVGRNELVGIVNRMVREKP
jgi:GTP-binding protein